MVPNYHEFAKHYLEEYKIAETEKEMKSRKKWFKAGKYTGMTGPSGKIYLLRSSQYGRHDEVHEIIHVLQGGPSKQFEGNEGLDECFTEYYAKKICSLLDIPDSPVAYPENSDFMRRLERVLHTELGATEADEVLFDAFWKRHRIEVLAEAIARKHIEKAQSTNWETKPEYYKESEIEKYKINLKKRAELEAKDKKPKKRKAVKLPKMKTQQHIRYFNAEKWDLIKSTKEAKDMLLNWKEKKSEFYWETVMGMEPRKNKKTKKQKPAKKKTKKSTKRKTSNKKEKEVATN
jgi:hypothetical protein